MDKQSCDLGTDFPEVFRRRLGRQLRVLHIGNVANNAYQNAKLLNSLGADCDVICYNYYHIMGCPEWEDADFSATKLDEVRPVWTTADLNGFSRPEWFAQGPTQFCLEYLLARRAKSHKARKYWLFLSAFNRTAEASTSRFLVQVERQWRRCLHFAGRRLGMLLQPRDVLLERIKIRLATDGVDVSSGSGRWIHAALELPALAAAIVLRLVAAPYRFARSTCTSPESVLDRWIADLESAFQRLFPARVDAFRRRDIQLQSLDYGLTKWTTLFGQYDLVHAYATDGIFPLLARKPYVACEHGTLREIPFEETPQGRCCALSYRLARHVLITNADNRVAAQKLGIARYSFVPHMVNESFLPDAGSRQGLYHKLHDDLASPFVVFCPSRQHWRAERRLEGDKGNDILLSGFAKFVKERESDAKALLVKWGTTIDQSMKLIERLGIAPNVVWIPPQPHPAMMRLICSSDLVADQFVIGAFGNIMPKALFCGCPAMMYFDESMHSWCFDSMPPIVNARLPEEVFEGLSRVYEDKVFVDDLTARGRQWYAKYHSNERVAEILLGAYQEVRSGDRPDYFRDDRAQMVHAWDACSVWRSMELSWSHAASRSCFGRCASSGGRWRAASRASGPALRSSPWRATAVPSACSG